MEVQEANHKVHYAAALPKPACARVKEILLIPPFMGVFYSSSKQKAQMPLNSPYFGWISNLVELTLLL